MLYISNLTAIITQQFITCILEGSYFENFCMFSRLMGQSVLYHQDTVVQNQLVIDPAVVPMFWYVESSLHVCSLLAGIG